MCVDGQVLLKYGQKGFCGGVIYKATWILTAAHCLEKLSVRFLKIVAGTVALEQIVKEIIALMKT